MTKHDENQDLIAKIVSAYAARPDAKVDDIAELTAKLSKSLGGGASSGEVGAPAAQRLISTPAIAIEDAVTPGKVYCLCCGKGFKMLKRHLFAEHGLTEEAYRAKFGLADDFPLVAPEYSEMKAKTAKKLGLGTYERKQTDSVS